MSIRSLLEALQKPLTQKLIFLEHWKTGAVPLPLESKPYRVWTLYDYTDKSRPPALPYHPVHNKNAFMEDMNHDWRWDRGTFYYYSRLVGGPVWVLLEYK